MGHENIHASGIGDEAGFNIQEQILAHQRLGWCQIELRTINKKQISELNKSELDLVTKLLGDANLKVSVIDSPIGNWERPITQPFERDLNELLVLIECANLLGTKYIRIMSYPNDGLTEENWELETLKRLTDLTKIAENNRVVLLHENCSGWAGKSTSNALKMLKEVNSPSLRLLLDIGNPIEYGYDGLEFMDAVWPWISHVHIKDLIVTHNQKITYTYPGLGQIQPSKYIKFLLEKNYPGSFSIEPHMEYIPHLSKPHGNNSLKTFVRYGRMFNQIINNFIQENS